MENLKQKALQAHKMWKGKVEVISRAKMKTMKNFLLYTPGVAEPCIAIQKKNPELSFI